MKTFTISRFRDITFSHTKQALILTFPTARRAQLFIRDNRTFKSVMKYIEKAHNAELDKPARCNNSNIVTICFKDKNTSFFDHIERIIAEAVNTKWVYGFERSVPFWQLSPTFNADRTAVIYTHDNPQYKLHITRTKTYPQFIEAFNRQNPGIELVLWTKTGNRNTFEFRDSNGQKLPSDFSQRVTDVMQTIKADHNRPPKKYKKQIKNPHDMQAYGLRKRDHSPTRNHSNRSCEDLHFLADLAIVRSEMRFFQPSPDLPLCKDIHLGSSLDI